ncbi:HGGxSTG domain-containing protein [Sedimenticola selenatireducens]|uniref:HGGxSTG domain-containing protein n=1 Tax=Sedimenticola selenatireducens TaxID=191960 RepID=UPI00056B1663|nr:HGGxSTG domain-containing protein [Sedimenticola selenatireducens]
MARKSGVLATLIGSRLTKADKAQIEHMSPAEVDQWVEARLADRQARGQANRKATRGTPKAQRPACGAKTRAGGRCKAPPVWDRERNQPRNGRCRMHGGLSTGPKTEAGRRRVAEAARRKRSG